MADEQYRWLDRETAERLLRGESPDAVDPAARDQAEQLAEALGALSTTPPLTSEELPGEAAALAAFRKVRAERDEERAALSDPARSRPADAGLIRIGARAGDRATDGRRPRRPRALRLGLAAALAAGMVGGVAFAAGTGALPSPFDDSRPRPGASVSAAPSGRPLATPSPEGAHGGGSAGPDGGRPSRDVAEEDAQGRDPEDRAAPSGGAGRSWTEVASSCRAVRDGRGLDADRRRALEGAAGGSTRVDRYCDGVLRNTNTNSGSTGGSAASGLGQSQGKGEGKGDNDNANGTTGDGAGGDGKGNDGKGDDGKGDGNGNGADDGHGIGRPGGHGHGQGHPDGNGGGGNDGGGNGGGKGHGEGHAAGQDASDHAHREVRTSPSPEPSFTPPYTTR